MQGLAFFMLSWQAPSEKHGTKSTFFYTFQKYGIYSISFGMQLLPRSDYQKQLRAFRDKQLVKVITGVRRCGKSSLLSLLRESLLADGVEEGRIVSINFEDFDADRLREPKALHDYLKSRLVPGKTTYILLDEIGLVDDFARVVDSLFMRGDVDLYITGSSANLLSADTAAMLTGRCVEIKMLPLSFREFVEATKAGDSLSAAYRRYLEKSSFPLAVELNTDQSVRACLEGVLTTILYKDVVARCKVGDAAVLDSLVRFLFDNIGSELSTRKIAHALSSTRHGADAKTIDKYLSGLVNSQLFYKARRFDVKGRRLLARLEKYYAVDLALRRIVLGRAAADAGHMLENVVYLELLRRGFDVSVGKYEDFEVDFVARDDNALFYLQVASTVRDGATLNRKLRPLLAIADNYPKILLTLDDDPPLNYNGIWRMNALEWLMGSVPPGS